MGVPIQRVNTIINGKRGITAETAILPLDLALADLRDEGDVWTVRSALGAVALAKGHVKLGAWIALVDDSEIDEGLESSAPMLHSRPGTCASRRAPGAAAIDNGDVVSSCEKHRLSEPPDPSSLL